MRELAIAVGAGGRAVGLDISADQVEAARTACGDLPAAEFVVGDANSLNFDDGAFDGIGSIQTLEYIANVDEALAEARRAQRPGGKAALVSVLRVHWRYHGAEPGLNSRMLNAWRAHCPHQMLPMELPRRLTAAGFGGISRRPIAFLNGALHENSYALWAAKVVAASAVSQGVAESEAALWLEQLAQADREGRFGFVSVPVLTTATAV